MAISHPLIIFMFDYCINSGGFFCNKEDHLLVYSNLFIVIIGIVLKVMYFPQNSLLV